MNRFSVWTICAALALAGGLSACSDDNPAAPGEKMDELIPIVTVGGAAGVFVNQAFPGASGGAPAPTVRSSAQIVRGGSVIVQVTTSGPASELLVRLADPQAGGHFVIDLAAASPPASVQAGGRSTAVRYTKRERGTLLSRGAVASAEGSTYALVITSASSLSLQALRFEIATRNGGAVSAPAPLDLGVNPDAGASDELQVSLNWNAPVDMDLHVETPSGEDIFYGNTAGAGGGALDLDSNAGCSIDGINNENITWGETDPEEGRYIVRVDLWSACDYGANIPFTVTTNMCSQTDVFDGTFSPSAETQGGAYSGRVVQVFERTPRLEKLEFWLSAFIPRNIPEYTLAAQGPHAGRTVVPSPLPGDDCYFTDQRSFSSNQGASHRMQSRVVLDFSGDAGRISSESHTVGPTHEISCTTGLDHGGIRQASNDRMDFSALRRNGNRYTIDVRGATGNPHFTLVPVPDADYEGTLTIDMDAGRVTFTGKVDDFPAYEAYLRVNDGEPITLFTRFDPSSRAFDLVGPAIHSLTGDVRLPCLRRRS
jgi:hypothetical protein